MSCFRRCKRQREELFNTVNAIMVASEEFIDREEELTKEDLLSFIEVINGLCSKKTKKIAQENNPYGKR